MKRFAMLFMVIMLCILSAGIITAQDNGLPNDPNINPAANACYIGGSLEGQCGNSKWGDADYMWTLGWYKIRYDYGIISRDKFPDVFKWILPSPEAEAEAAVAFCMVEIDAVNSGALGLTSPIVRVPLSVIRGLSDPNASPGATPYDFDWVNGPRGPALYIYGPNASVSGSFWGQQFGWWGAIISNSCPTPTPPI